MYASHLDAYLEIGIMTSEPHQLILMCYDGAIVNLKAAKELYLSKDYELKAKALKKALGMIGELIKALNFEKGGEIAFNLNALYRYMIKRVLEGDINKDVKAFDEVVGLLEVLASAWKAIAPGNIAKTMLAKSALTGQKQRIASRG